MKKIVYCFLFLFSIGFSFAQTSEKAKQLLNEVSSKMTSYDNMSIKFKYTLENKEADLHQESSGFVTTKKEKYNLNFMDNIFIFDGNKTYVIIPEDEEINIVDAAESEEMLTPSKLLFFYKEGYNYSWDISKNNIQYIKLTPIDSASESSHFLVGIDTNTKLTSTITEVGNNGTETIFEIVEFKANQDISEDLFVFNKAKFEEEGYTINE